MLFIVGYEALDFGMQFARMQKVKRDIEFPIAPMYLFLHILQAETHLLLLVYNYTNLYYTGKEGEMSYILERLSVLWYGIGGMFSTVCGRDKLSPY